MEEDNQVVNNPVTEDNVDSLVAEGTKPQAGESTDPSLLLKSLQVEREKRRIAEEKARLLEQATPSEPLITEAFSDEGKLLERQFNQKLSELEKQLSQVTSQSQKQAVLDTYPILKEKWSDFESFYNETDNKGMSLKTAAKAYLVENDLLGSPRKGLEKPTGGDRKPAEAGMTAAEVKTLRETNFKKYQEMLLKGAIKIIDKT